MSLFISITLSLFLTNVDVMCRYRESGGHLPGAPARDHHGICHGWHRDTHCQLQEEKYADLVVSCS